MGDLPSERITPSRPFENTGIDLCGPFLIKDKKLRKSPKLKVYVAIFVCFATKATHLEVLSDLTTACFLACLKRFIYRRGKPNSIWTDNATNFVGSKNEMDRWYNLLQKDSKIQLYHASHQINWHFIPPRSPNFGGLWESAVRSFKHHFKRIASNTCFSYEELHTVVTQIEGILNSRPLTALSTDPNDPLPLTPGHFLIGGPMVAPIEPTLTDVSSNRLSNWNKVTQVVQHFWKRYSLEFVHSLQQRTKWKNKTQDLKINDMVLINDDNMPTAKWTLGIVLKTYSAKDNHIRVVIVKTKDGELKRSIHKLCKLPLED